MLRKFQSFLQILFSWRVLTEGMLYINYFGWIYLWCKDILHSAGLQYTIVDSLFCFLLFISGDKILVKLSFAKANFIYLNLYLPLVY